MIRLAVYAQYEEFHRRLWLAVADSTDLRIDLRYRSTAEMTASPAVDVAVLFEPDPRTLQHISSRLPADSSLVILAQGESRAELHRLVNESQRRFAVLGSDVTDEVVILAVRSVSEGLYVFDERSSGTDESIRSGRSPEADVSQLTDRELEVLKLLADGLSNRAIGRALGVSENTVKYHLTGLYGSLNVHTRGEALIEAVRRGLISL